MPLVSIILATYNQEAYIAAAIQSALNQTCQDFEIIILNDGSTDGTADCIRPFLVDPRLKYIEQPNQGPITTYNRGLELAQGQYISFLPGDDYYYPDKIACQIEYLQTNNQHLVFSWVDFVDDFGQLIEGEHWARPYFNHPHRPRSEVLWYFFFGGNYLSLTTLLARREVFEEFGLFNPVGIQLSDFEYYLKLLKQPSLELPVLEERLAQYRIRADAQQVSSPHNKNRIVLETLQIYRHFFDGIDPEFFRHVFYKELHRTDFAGPFEFELEKALLFFKHNTGWVQILGSEKLYTLLQDPAIRAIAAEHYSLDLPAFYRLSNQPDYIQQAQVEQARAERDELERVLHRDWANLSGQIIVLQENLAYQATVEADLQARNQWRQGIIENLQTDLAFAREQTARLEATWIVRLARITQQWGRRALDLVKRRRS